MAVNVKVGLIGKLDMLKFKNMKKVREKAIEEAPFKEVVGEFKINTNARKLHPDFLKLIVADIIEHKAADSKTFILKRLDGGALPYFRAGQYLSLKLSIGDSLVTRAYSICSSPKEALEGKYAITVRNVKDGFVANRLLNDTKIGDELISSGPLGLFYYEGLRDCKQVIGLAGGSGITPFMSMAYAIRDGIEDFDLTILYGSRSEDSILFKEELDALAAECPRIKVVHILSDEQLEQYETGFISAELIKKYAPENDKYSVFFCGPDEMYRFIKEEVEKLDIPARYFRSRAIGVTKNVSACEGYPAASKDQIYKITVKQGERECVIDADSNETILVAFERACIKAPSRCRSGECGWCRAKIISGTFYVPAENEMRRWADVEYGYIHPCVSFATSDMVIEVPGEFY